MVNLPIYIPMSVVVVVVLILRVSGGYVKRLGSLESLSGGPLNLDGIFPLLVCRLGLFEDVDEMLALSGREDRGTLALGGLDVGESGRQKKHKEVGREERLRGYLRCR